MTSSARISSVHANGTASCSPSDCQSTLTTSSFPPFCCLDLIIYHQLLSANRSRLEKEKEEEEVFPPDRR